ncbi:MAG: hypothetical protein WD225_07265 [Ilumatobacteraceae bacterium]
MRQVFSLRFFAAIGATAGLFLLLSLVFGGGDRVAELSEPEPIERRIDLVAEVFAPVDTDFELGDDGVTRGSLDLVLDADRTVQVVSGTHGEITCDELDRIGACAVVADLLGDAVVWFALVPMASDDIVEMPAIDVLEDDDAVLVNGWRVPYARVLDRRCAQQFASYREFRQELGDAFTSIYSIEERELVAVRCDPEALSG